MTFTIRLSDLATKDLDRLDRRTQDRVRKRLRELAQDPFDERLSTSLTNMGGQRKSRIGGWRIIFRVDRGELIVLVLTIARRGQVYKRL